MRAAGIARRRSSGGGGGGGGGGGPSFLSLTSWARPFTQADATRLVPFTTTGGLTTALNNIQAGDYIYYNGNGVLPFTSGSGAVLNITGHNMSSTTVIDFGTSNSIWGSPVSGNYCSFSFTGNANQNAISLNNCSNLTLYGGYVTAPTGNQGLLCQAPLTNILWYDLYIYYVGGSGIAVRPQTGSGTASVTNNITIRAEVNRWSMFPSYDSHTDRGTGFHALILHGLEGQMNDCTWAIYGHDPLKPGESANGYTWPEGGGGCVIEFGQSPTTSTTINNNTGYAWGVNVLGKPNLSNPNPTTPQGAGSTAPVGAMGNIINQWGTVPLNGLVIG